MSDRNRQQANTKGSGDGLALEDDIKNSHCKDEFMSKLVKAFTRRLHGQGLPLNQT